MSSTGESFLRSSVWIEKFDCSIAGARQKLLVPRPGHSLHNVLVRLGIPYLLPANQIPNFDNSITTATCKSFKTAWVFCHRIHSIYMALSHLADERGSKHSLQLRRIESTGIFDCFCERFCAWSEVERLFLRVCSWGLDRSHRTRESFDFLHNN